MKNTESFKTETDTKLESLEATVLGLKQHPVWQQIEAERASETLAKRQQAGAELNKLTQEQSEAIPKLRATLAEKQAVFEKAKTAFDEAANELQKAKANLANGNIRFENVISKQREILIESAPKELGEAIELFQKKIAWLRAPGRIMQMPASVEKNVFAETKVVSEESNFRSVNGALSYCRGALKELEIMKQTPELDRAKIEAMKQAIPDVSIFERFESEKPLPKGPDGKPFVGLMGDWELNKRKEDVLKKADKLLHRRK